MKFNDQFHEITGVYPLEVSITIAQACNHVFRKNFLKKNTIGVGSNLMYIIHFFAGRTITHSVSFR